MFPDDLAERFLAELRKAGRIVTVARHLLPGLEQRGFARVSCIQNAVDAQRFAPLPRDRALAARLGVADSDVVVLHAAQIKPIKRPLDIVRSAPDALRRQPELLYVVVGEGQSLHEMKTLACESGVGERFRFVPFVENDVMPRYMSLADLVITPSEREGLSRVYLEAQACGKTLVASDIAGAREVVTHHETGLLCRKGDVADLAATTARAAGDPQLRAAIGRRAREQVVRHHDIERAVDRYVALVEDLVRYDARDGT